MEAAQNLEKPLTMKGNMNLQHGVVTSTGNDGEVVMFFVKNIAYVNVKGNKITITNSTVPSPTNMIVMTMDTEEEALEAGEQIRKSMQQSLRMKKNLL